MCTLVMPVFVSLFFIIINKTFKTCDDMIYIYLQGKSCEDIISTLRNGSAAENAFTIMQEKGLLLPRRSRHRLTPGTVKFAAFHVLSLEGSEGLTVLELADKIQVCLNCYRVKLSVTGPLPVGCWPFLF